MAELGATAAVVGIGSLCVKGISELIEVLEKWKTHNKDVEEFCAKLKALRQFFEEREEWIHSSGQNDLLKSFEGRINECKQSFEKSDPNTVLGKITHIMQRKKITNSLTTAEELIKYIQLNDTDIICREIKENTHVNTNEHSTSDTRPTETVDTVTWHTFQYTPLIFVFSRQNLMWLTSFDMALIFLLMDSKVQKYLDINYSNNSIKQLIDSKGGRRLILDSIEMPEDEYRQRYDDQKKINLVKLTDWYNHIAKSCSTWEFPIKEGQTDFLPAWNMSTCTPNIPRKTTNTIHVPQNMSWIYILKKKYLVMTCTSNDDVTESNIISGSLLTGSRMLALVSPNTVRSGNFLSCFDNSAELKNGNWKKTENAVDFSNGRTLSEYDDDVTYTFV